MMIAAITETVNQRMNSLGIKTIIGQGRLMNHIRKTYIPLHAHLSHMNKSNRTQNNKNSKFLTTARPRAHHKSRIINPHFNQLIILRNSRKQQLK